MSFLKSWLHIPKHGVNTAFLHDKHGLNIPTISELYQECHSLAHSQSRIKGDSLVNSALDSKISRESKWTRQLSTVCTSEDQHKRAISDITNDTEVQTWKTTKQAVKKTIQQDRKSYWSENIQQLIFQGDFLKLLHQEENDITWKSIIYDMPTNVLRFAVNASINCLPTNDNLSRWGKKTSNKCKLCNNVGTLHHILNNCDKMLERYGWRHNSILHCLIKTILQGDQKECIKTYSDLENFTIAGGTIPPNILPTELKPDIVIVWKNSPRVSIIELTVPFETNIEKAHTRKTNKYAPLCQDIKNQGYTVDYWALEIGSHGYVNKNNAASLKSIIKQFKCNIQPKKLSVTLSKLALLGSYSIYISRNEPNWDVDNYIKI